MKTTNPSLVKRFYKGTVEVGDHSKDFIIEPDYALVFNGKVTYRSNPVKCMVAWRDMAGKYHNRSFYKGHPVHALMQGLTKMTNFTNRERSDYSGIAKTILGIIGGGCIHGKSQTGLNSTIENFNYVYEHISPEGNVLFWEDVRKLSDGHSILSNLWGGQAKLDVSDLHEDVAAFIMERRMSNDKK